MNSYQNQCFLCYEQIPHHYPYAMLDTSHNYYHVHCLEYHLDKHQIDESYTIYQQGKEIINKKPMIHYHSILDDASCCQLF
jgi:hypothetical protein